MMEAPDIMQFVALLTDYLKPDAEGSLEMLDQCFALIQAGADVKLAIALLKDIRKNSSLLSFFY
jgi:hypothetical protein